MAVIPFGEYTPDLPSFQNQGITRALNVVPLTSKSYGPFAALKPFSMALPARCQGAFGAKDYSNVGYLFAGDATGLYIWGKSFEDAFFVDGFFLPGFFLQQTSGLHTWVDISGPFGYALGSESVWQFVQFGNYVIACTLGNQMQIYTLGSTDTFSDLSGDAPQATCCAVIRDFVMFGNMVGPDGVLPNQVWWPAINDPTNWPTPGTSAAAAVQSDNQILPEGGAIQGIVGAIGGADGAIFMDDAIYRVTYIGAPAVFQFDKVEKQKGTRIPGSIVNVGSMAFYLGVDGFYAFDGINSIPIGQDRVDRTFYDDFDQSYYYRVVSTVDVLNKQVLWAYPGSDHSDGAPNRILIFNWSTKRWSLVEHEVEYFFRSYTTGYTLEELDQFGTMETLPYSLDSRFWAGGSILLSGFDTDHKIGTFSGDNLEATIDTGEFDAGDGQRAFVSGVRPVSDCDNAEVSLGYRDRLGSAINYTLPSSMGVDGICPQRLSTRYVRASVVIPAAESWTHAQGIEPVVQPDGDR